MREAVAVLILVLLAAQAPPAGATPPFVVLLASPNYVASGATADIAGVVRASGLGMPLMQVDLMLDGTLAESALTDTAGGFHAQVAFPARRGTVSLYAAVHRGTPLETLSPVYTVSLVVPPTPPRNFSAVQTANAVRLAWTPPADPGGAAISAYLVERSVDGADWQQIASLPGSTRSYDAPMIASATHAYRARAKNVVGPGNATETIGGFVSAPGAPTGLALTRSGGVVHVAWSAPAGGAVPLDHYDIERNGAIVGQTASTSYEDATVAPSMHYTYRVSATGPGGVGPFTDAEPLVTLPAAPPDATAAYVPNSRYIRLTWSPPAGPVPNLEYHVERLVAGEWQEVATVDGDVEMYERGGFAWGQTYVHRVRALNIAGYGPYSAELSATLPAQVASQLTMAIPYALICHAQCETFAAGDEIPIYGPDASFKPIVKGRLTDQAGEGYAGPSALLVRLDSSWSDQSHVQEEWIATTTAGNYTAGIDPYVTFTGQAVGECRDISYGGTAQYQTLFGPAASVFRICRAG